MSDIEQKITILDGFTEPLEELKDAIKDVYLQNDVLTESVKVGKEEFNDFSSNIRTFADDVRNGTIGVKSFNKSVLGLGITAFDVGNTIRKSIAVSAKGYGSLLKFTFKEQGKAIREIGQSVKMAGLSFDIFRSKAIPNLKEFASFTKYSVKLLKNDLTPQIKHFARLTDMNLMSLKFDMAESFTTKLKMLDIKQFLVTEKSFLDPMKKSFIAFQGRQQYWFSPIRDNLKELRGNLWIVSKDMQKAFGKLGEAIQHTSMIAKNSIKAIGKGFLKGIGKAAKGIISDLMLGWVNKASTRLFKAGVNAYKNMFDKMFASIEPYIDRIEEADKMTAMFGASKAESFNNKMYMWSQQHGQNAKVVSQLGSKAAYEGIGTKHLDKLLTFADKISTLSPGKTFEDTASSLIENIKRGHDAGTISQMLGGGQLMERQLRWKGYERALRRGDIDKALEIAEKVAEQAGITDDKYKEAGESMAKNFTAIQNITENIRNRFGTEFNKQFAPAIKKIRQFLESEGFQKFINGLTTVVRLIGKGFNKAIEFAIDHIDTLGILLGVAVGTKIFLIVRSMKTWIGLAKFLFPVIKFLLGPLGKILGGMVHLIKTLGISKALVRAIGASLKRTFLSPIVIAAAALGGALFLIHKISGVAETFPSFLAGFGTFLQNAFENLLIMLENVGKFILSIPTRIKMIGPMIRTLIMKFIGWLGDKIMSLNEGLGQKLKDMSERGIDDADWDRQEYEHQLQKYAPREFIDSMRGVQNAMDNNKTWGDLFKNTGIKGLLEKIDKKLGLTLGIGDEISTNTNLIKESMEQEEELRWLKAFSDRQIGSAYNSMTSSTVNTTINGASQQVIMNLGRRDPKSVSPRAKKYA